METLKEKINTKLNYILNEIKDLQKTIVHLNPEKKKIGKKRILRWLVLGERVSSKWKGFIALDEIRDQREKRW